MPSVRVLTVSHALWVWRLHRKAHQLAPGHLANEWQNPHRNELLTERITFEVTELDLDL